MKRFIPIFLACLCLTACKKTNATDSALSSDSLSLKLDTIYEGETPLLTNLSLSYGNMSIFDDSVTYYETNSGQVIRYNDTILYLFINEFDPISMKSLHVVRVSNYKASEKVIYGQLIKDIDQDGILEIIGQELSEVACLDCDSAEYATYSPVLVHKLDEYCILDEVLTKELTILKYGCYLGEQCIDTFLPTKPIIYNGITLW